MSNYKATPEDIARGKKRTKRDRRLIFGTIAIVLLLFTWWALREVYDIYIFDLIINSYKNLTQ